MHARSLLLLAIALFGNAAATSPTYQNTTDIVDSSDPTVIELCSIMPLGRTILRPNSCNRWTRCPTTAGGNDYDEGACVAGLYYNKDSETCEPLSKVSCPYATGSQNDMHTADRCASQPEGTYLPDDSDCSYFYYCTGGKALRSGCPSDLVFHADRRECVYRNTYSCPKPSEQLTPDPICRSMPNGMRFAHERECVKYHVCEAGVLVTEQCENNFVFDHLSGRCVEAATATCLAGAKMPEPENTICGTKQQPRVGYFSDERSCSGYYICGEVQADGTPDRNPYHLHCEAGLFFDAQRLSCRDRLNVKCTLDRCVGMGNKYVNIAGDCAAYAHCKDGVAVRTGSCPKGYFFDERSQGCTEHNINYVACSA